MNDVRMTVVIPSRNEGDWLVRTVRSIRENESADTEIIHVDDASTLPEPDLSQYDVKQIRLQRREGAARARARGMLAARPESGAIVTCDSHELFGPADALAAFLEEIERFKTIGAIKSKDYSPSMWEAKVHMAPNKLQTLANIAVANNGIAYCGPCRQGAASIYWRGGLLRVGWLARIKEPAVIQTAGAFGGLYVYARDAFEQMGGYPQLPGYFGFEEEATALLAAGCRVPILCATEISHWHVFRSQGADPIPCPYQTPEDRQLDNLAAVYRLAFGEKMWQSRWRKVLATETLPGRARPVPEYALQSVETPAFTAYRDAVQERMELHDEALLDELERRMGADRERKEAMEQGGS